jgi:polyphosphate glucokinase
MGSAFIVDGILASMELGHLPYKKGTFEDYLGAGGLRKRGIRKWRNAVEDAVKRLIDAVQPDDVVIGGGNVWKLKTLPTGCRRGNNANAFLGGFRLWEPSWNARCRLCESGQPKNGRRSGQNCRSRAGRRSKYRSD